MFDVAAVFAAATSHAQTLGVFDKVTGHEPKSSPGTGVSASFWLERMRPIPSRSGLDSTSMLLVISIRVYLSMLVEPQDEIDPRVLAAAGALIEAYSGDFDLDGLVSHVDLLGAYWPDGLQARAGYLDIDHKKYRVAVLDLPLVLNDVMAQVA